jgi:phosphoribosylformimino-5-aminoimidazole carboxamide ribotide isomerase
MELYAAIDLRDGRAVRLLKGDYGRETVYGDPLALAEEFIVGGADWLHLVDLDAARDANAANRSVIETIASMSPIPVEVGGGVRSLLDAEQILAGGAQRVILGTVAVEDPALARVIIEQHPGHVAVGLDYRRQGDGVVIAVRGWLEGSPTSLTEGIERLIPPESAAVILTAIDRDGTLEGPDVEGLQVALAATDVEVIASGGVGSLDDLRLLSSLRVGGLDRGVSGVVVGKALVEGRFNVTEGVAACR